MKTWRFASWALITLLLLHGGGVLTSLHKLSHLTRGVQAMQCDHGHAHHAQQPSDDRPAPSPSPDDDRDCSICMGLSGLHLANAPASLPVVSLAILVDRTILEAAPMRQREPHRDHAARAPPIC